MLNRYIYINHRYIFIISANVHWYKTILSQFKKKKLRPLGKYGSYGWRGSRSKLKSPKRDSETEHALPPFINLPVLLTLQSRYLCATNASINIGLVSPRSLSDDRFHFPDWLELLLTCACFVDHFETHTAAVSTMLDLISLTKSIISESECKGQSEGQEDWYQPRRSTSEGTVSVVIVPSISPKHLKFLNEKTQFYQVSFFSM